MSALSLIEVINKSAAYLTAAGLPAARLEAELLLAKVAGLDRIQLYVQFDRPVTEAELGEMRLLLSARAKERVPLVYLTGRKRFLDFELRVPPGVFIPRPETEELAAAFAGCLQERHPGPEECRLLDLGTGSGALALALARRFPQAEVWAVDLSVPAVAAAQENADGLGLSGRVHFLQGDLWEALPPAQAFTGIIANPPYIRRDDLTALAPEIVQHEPYLALDGGIDGLDCYRRIFSGLAGRLRPGGLLGLEHGEDQAEALMALAARAGLIRCRDLPDLAGRPRIFLAEAKDGSGA